MRKRWDQLSPATTPQVRADFQAVWDEANGEAMFFGGGFVPDDETWKWDGSDWNLQSPATAPEARSGYAMDYDPVNGYVLLFGGIRAASPHRRGDTWKWDGSNWTNMSAPLTPVLSPAMAGHSAGLILFGGSSTGSGSAGDYLSTTYRWTGSGWTALTPAHNPNGRFVHSMGYDRVSDTVILFGGSQMDSGGTTSSIDDTWEWDGTDWTQVSAGGAYPTTPGTDAHTRMAWNDDLQMLLLFGGQWDTEHGGGPGGGISLSKEVWAWNRTSWELIDVCQPYVPGPGFVGPGDVGGGIAQHGWCWDPILRKMLLFGGDVYDPTPNETDETWVFGGTCNRPQLIRWH